MTSHDLSWLVMIFRWLFDDFSVIFLWFFDYFWDVLGMFGGCFGDVSGWFGNDQWKCFGRGWGGNAPPPKYGLSPALNSPHQRCNHGGSARFREVRGGGSAPRGGPATSPRLARRTKKGIRGSSKTNQVIWYDATSDPPHDSSAAGCASLIHLYIYIWNVYIDDPSIYRCSIYIDDPSI